MKSTRSPYSLEAEVLASLAHPMRVQILELLREGEACVCHLQAMLGQRQAYISQHLMALRQAGWVTRRKEGLRVFYRVSEPQIFAVLDSAQVMARAQRKTRGLPIERKLTLRPGRCHCPRCAGAPLRLKDGRSRLPGEAV